MIRALTPISIALLFSILPCLFHTWPIYFTVLRYTNGIQLHQLLGSSFQWSIPHNFSQPLWSWSQELRFASWDSPYFSFRLCNSRGLFRFSLADQPGHVHCPWWFRFISIICRRWCWGAPKGLDEWAELLVPIISASIYCHESNYQWSWWGGISSHWYYSYFMRLLSWNAICACLLMKEWRFFWNGWMRLNWSRFITALYRLIAIRWASSSFKPTSQARWLFGEDQPHGLHLLCLDLYY